MFNIAIFSIFSLLISLPSDAFAKKRCKKNEVIGGDCDYASIRFIPNVEWQSIEQYLDEDILYKFTTRLSKDWQDDTVPANLEGWIKFKPLAKAYSVLEGLKVSVFIKLDFAKLKSIKIVSH